jgi:hypothetical protein
MSFRKIFLVDFSILKYSNYELEEVYFKIVHSSLFQKAFRQNILMVSFCHSERAFFGD